MIVKTKILFFYIYIKLIIKIILTKKMKIIINRISKSFWIIDGNGNNTISYKILLDYEKDYLKIR